MRSARALHEREGVVEQAGPVPGLGMGDGRPLAEPAAGGSERLGPASADKVVDAFLRELDQEVPGAAVAGCEERAVHRRRRRPIRLSR